MLAWLMPVVLMGVGALATVTVAWLSMNRRLLVLASVVAFLPCAVGSIAFTAINSNLEAQVSMLTDAEADVVREQGMGEAMPPLVGGGLFSVVALVGTAAALVRPRRT